MPSYTPEKGSAGSSDEEDSTPRLLLSSAKPSPRIVTAPAPTPAKATPARAYISNRLGRTPQKQEQNLPPFGGKGSPAKATINTKTDVRSIISDDLTSTLSAWATQAERLYGDSPPVAEVSVTVVAATGVSKLDRPYWLVTVAGVTDQTGTSTPLKEPVMQAPVGAPSWQAHPLTLAVQDPTADVLLLLCEAGGARHACVGRGVVPLSELLPLVPISCVQPGTLETWIDIFPPAAEYAEGSVQPFLGAALDDVEGTGMARPAQKGRALVRVCLTAQQSLLSAYLQKPSFDAALGASGEARASRVQVPPERVQGAAVRVRRLLGALLQPPACVRLIEKRPLTSGIALCGMAWWLCFEISGPVLPWWLLAAWVLNGYSLRVLHVLELPPPPWTPVPIASEEGGGQRAAVRGQNAAPVTSSPPTIASLRSPEEKLQRLEEAVMPLLMAVEEAASTIERLISAFSFADPRASAFALGPAIGLTALCWVGLLFLSLPVAIMGGLPNFVFGSTIIYVLLTILNVHRTEMLSQWEGEDRGASVDRRFGAGTASTAAQLRFTMDSARSADSARDGNPFNTERRTALASWARSYFEWVGHVWSRIPDEPMREHRAMAHAATQSSVQADKAKVFPPCF